MRHTTVGISVRKPITVRGRGFVNYDERAKVNYVGIRFSAILIHKPPVIHPSHPAHHVNFVRASSCNRFTILVNRLNRTIGHG